MRKEKEEEIERKEKRREERKVRVGPQVLVFTKRFNPEQIRSQNFKKKIPESHFDS